ncbi:MAG: PASTA domain-containing protein [Prevotella sp.]|nr:PASTA domain-containing protein [Prevotella sp.]
MKTSTFFKKIFSFKLWANLFAMALVIVLLCFGVKYGMDIYTHHGEKISVPDIRNKSFADAEHILHRAGLQIEVSDTGFVKALPPDCILEQSLTPGTIVKSGRIVFVVINASNTPTLTIPDVIDNSSYREARARMIAMGFKIGDPEYVPGEKDWVYGIKCRGRLLVSGQKVPVDALVIIQVGDGLRDETDSVAYIDPIYDPFEETEEEEVKEEPATTENTEEDEFEVVTGPE